MAIHLLLLSIHLLLSDPGSTSQANVKEPFTATLNIRTDSIKVLQKEWVLREMLRRKQQEMVPVAPVPSVLLSFQEGGVYQIIQLNEFPSRVNGDTVVEQGTWELQPGKGLIGVQVAQVNAHAIKSMMLNRWEIVKLQPTQLVLRQLGKGEEYLVFEPRDNKR